MGWRCREGVHCTGNSCALGCPNPAFTEPIHEYDHGGTPFRCSITGGFVYRGCAIPEYEGRYFFGDYCSDQIWSISFNGSQVLDTLEHTDDFQPDAGVINDISSFGRDGYGELYICCLNGNIFRIVPDNLTDENGNGIDDACECIPDEVVDLNAIRSGDDIRLEWTPDGDEAATTRIYRSGDQTATFPDDWLLLASDVTGGTYLDANPLNEGELFCYLVVTECP